MYSITAHAAQVNNFDGLLSKHAFKQGLHASVLQYSTSVLHSTSTTALLDKGHQVCRQPCTALPLMLLK